MKAPALLALALTAIAVAAGLWLLATEEREGADTGARASSAPSGSLASAHRAPLSAAPLSSAPLAALPAARSAPDDGRPRVAGHVRVPGGLAPFPDVRVSAEVHVGRENITPPVRLDAPVALDDGAFELRLPHDARYALLDVRARLLYQPESVRALPDETGVVLAPFALAEVHGRVLLPPGLDAGELERFELACWPEEGHPVHEQPHRAHDPQASFQLHGQTWPFELQPEPDGVYRFIGVPAGVALVIETLQPAPLAAVARVAPLLPGERRTLDLGLALATDCIAGSVTWPDGTPARDFGVNVLCGREHTGWPADEPLADGHFVVCGVGAEPCTVEVRAVGDGVTGSATLEGVRGGQIGLELVLATRPVFAVEGIVLDAALQPLEHFDVQTAGSWRRIPPDRDGRFRIEGLESGEQGVTVDAKRHLSETRLVLIGPNTEPQRFVLLPAGRLRGIVVDPLDRPVPDAEITASRVRSYQGENVRADADGRFDVFAIASTVRLSAWSPGLAPSETLELAVASGEIRDGLVLRLREPCRLRGRVVDHAGEPIAGASVYASRARAETDERGEFTLDGLPPGTVDVDVNVLAPDGDGRSARAQATLGPTRAWIELRIEPRAPRERP